MKNNLNQNLTLCSLDFETTGVPASVGRVVEFAFIKFDTVTRERKVFSNRVNPGIQIPEEATKVHNISNDDVANCLPFAFYLPEIIAFIEDCVLCSHNGNDYDIPLLQYECKRANFIWEPDMTKVIDTMQVFRVLHSAALSAVFERYAKKSLEGAHGAAADASAVLEIIEGMMRDHNLDHSQLTTHSLSHMQKRVDVDGKLYRNEFGIVCFKFGKYKDQSVLEILGKGGKDVKYLDWMKKTDGFKDTFAIDSIEKIISEQK